MMIVHPSKKGAGHI